MALFPMVGLIDTERIDPNKGNQQVNTTSSFFGREN
jgi:hypothetical protein